MDDHIRNLELEILIQRYILSSLGDNKFMVDKGKNMECRFAVVVAASRILHPKTSKNES